MYRSVTEIATVLCRAVNFRRLEIWFVPRNGNQGARLGDGHDRNNCISMCSVVMLNPNIARGPVRGDPWIG